MATSVLQKLNYKAAEAPKQNEWTVMTPLGDINAIPSSDPLYPGMFIEVNGTQVALIEYDSSVANHVIRVWDYNDSEGDYIYKQHLNSEENEE